jgi:hypothetical protein
MAKTLAYYLSRLGLPLQEGEFMMMRRLGLNLLSKEFEAHDNKPPVEADGELWTLKNVLRRLLWHDRIHAKAIARMMRKQEQLGLISDYPDPFHVFPSSDPKLEVTCSRMSKGWSGMRIQNAEISDAEEILSLQKLAYKSEAEIYNDLRISPFDPVPRGVARGFQEAGVSKGDGGWKDSRLGQSLCKGRDRLHRQADRPPRPSERGNRNRADGRD